MVLTTAQCYWMISTVLTTITSLSSSAYRLLRLCLSAIFIKIMKDETKYLPTFVTDCINIEWSKTLVKSTLR